MRPTPRSLLLLLAGFAAALSPVVLGAAWWTPWPAFLAVFVLLLGLDALLLPARSRLRVEPRVPDTVSVGQAEDLVVSLAAPRWPFALGLALALDVEGDVAAPPEARLRLAPGGEGRAAFALRPRRRGTFVARRLWLAWSGPLGLASHRAVLPLDAEIRVVPDVKGVRTAALSFFRTRDAYVGSKVVRHAGEGSEFEALREHVPGLDPRSIHWKASARHRRLIAVEHRAERNHPVVLAVDTGRLMREPLGGVARLDHAVHAALALAYAALRTGDRVGWFAFDARPHAFAEPRGGVRAFSRLQRLAATLAYADEETNFTLALAELGTRLRRRSLVVLFTDFVDVVTAELMLENLGRLAKRHLVVFVTLRDPRLDEEASAPPRTAEVLYRAIVAHELARDRDLVLRRLARLGIFALDVPPATMSSRLLARYLEIKRRELV